MRTFNYVTDPRTHPRNPDLYLGMIAIFAPLSLYLLARNWRKLNKPDWMLNTLLCYALIILLFIFSLVAITRLDRSLAPLAAVALVIFTVAHYGYILTIHQLQRGAYQYWVANNQHKGYQYNFGRSIGLSFLGVGAIVAIGIVAFTISDQPRVLNFDDMAMSVDSRWDPRSFASSPDCDEPAFFECLVLLNLSQSYTQVLVGRSDVINDLPVREYEEEGRAWLDFYPGAAFLRVEYHTLDSVDAVYVHYTMPPIEGERINPFVYMMEVWLIKDGKLYQFYFNAISEGAFEENRWKIDALLAGVDFL